MPLLGMSKFSLEETFLLIFSSDGGLPASPFFSKVHPKLNVPLNSLYLNLGLVIIFGCIFLGSSRLVVTG